MIRVMEKKGGWYEKLRGCDCSGQGAQGRPLWGVTVSAPQTTERSQNRKATHF